MQLNVQSILISFFLSLLLHLSYTVYRWNKYIHSEVFVMQKIIAAHW